MGVSVNAYLAYGVSIKDWEVLDSLPWSPHGPDEEVVDEYSEQRPSFATWLLKLEGTAPIIKLEGYHDDSYLVLAVKDTVTVASWGTPEAPAMTFDPEKLKAAQQFCELHAIPFEDPKWLLFSDSDYGS